MSDGRRSAVFVALAALLAGFLATPVASAAGAALQPDEVDPDDVPLSVTIEESGDATATWTAGTSLDEFELTAAPDDGATTTATDADGAGPGAAVALVAVALAAAALLVRR